MYNIQCEKCGYYIINVSCVENKVYQTKSVFSLFQNLIAVCEIVWQIRFEEQGNMSHHCGQNDIPLCYFTQYDGSNPGGGKIFRTRPHWPWGPPSLLYNGYQVFPKRLGHDIDHPSPSSAEAKERVQLYRYSPSGPSWPVLG